MELKSIKNSDLKFENREEPVVEIAMTVKGWNKMTKDLDFLERLRQIGLQKQTNGYFVSYNGENSFVGEKLGKLLEEIKNEEFK